MIAALSVESASKFRCDVLDDTSKRHTRFVAKATYACRNPDAFILGRHTGVQQSAPRREGDDCKKLVTCTKSAVGVQVIPRLPGR